MRAIANAALKLYFSRRVDQLVAAACRGLAPGALGVALTTLMRVLVATRLTQPSKGEAGGDGGGGCGARAPGSTAAVPGRPRGLGAGLPPPRCSPARRSSGDSLAAPRRTRHGSSHDGA